MSKFTIRKAQMADVKPIHSLLLTSAERGLLLPRPLHQLYGRLRDFFVVHHEDRGVLGCCALSICWDNLAEIRSLVVHPDARGLGLGKRLVAACLDEASTLGLQQVFALTYCVRFFQDRGFHIVPKDHLPQKIWADCINCAKFPDCDETAVVIRIGETPEVA